MLSVESVISRVTDALNRIAFPLSVPKGTVVFKEGDHAVGVYIVHKGVIRMTVKSVQGEVVLRIAQPGSVIGLSGVLGNAPYSLTATTIEAADLGFVPAPNLLEAIRTNPSLGLQILHLLSEDVRAARNVIANGCQVH